MIKFTPLWKKIPEVALYVRGRYEKPCAMGIIFLADIAHLEGYGRPVTFDNYLALRSGPTPVATSALWDSIPPRAYNPDMLSVTDVRVLDEAALRIMDHGLGVACAHPAYVAAWEGRPHLDAAPMDWCLMFDDAGHLCDLAYMSGCV